MVTVDETWVTYDNIVQNWSWAKRVEAAQTEEKPELTARMVLMCIWWDWKGIIYYRFLRSHPQTMTRRKDISLDEAVNLLRELTENESGGGELSCSNSDSEEDIGLTESDCEESQEMQV
ncbi:hypothetical protein TNCV_1271071 [Trichonephila clavipes]|nr:hypothetical protein TNCV_1271071 [Trichonephila clavipes]